MRVIALIDDPGVVRRILDALKAKQAQNTKGLLQEH
jgi:hypothetical protein